MKKRLKFIVAYIFFWLLYFQLVRIIFLMYHWVQTDDYFYQGWMEVAWQGLLPDLNMALLLSVLPSLLVALTFFLREGTLVSSLTNAYTGILVAFFTLMHVADMEAYTAIGHRINADILVNMPPIKEVVSGISMQVWLKIVLLFIALLAAFLAIYFEWIGEPLANARRSGLGVFFFFLVFAALPYLLLSGILGFTIMSLQEGLSFESVLLKETSENLFWNLRVMVRG